MRSGMSVPARRRSAGADDRAVQNRGAHAMRQQRIKGAAVQHGGVDDW